MHRVFGLGSLLLGYCIPLLLSIGMAHGLLARSWLTGLPCLVLFVLCLRPAFSQVLVGWVLATRGAAADGYAESDIGADDEWMDQVIDRERVAAGLASLSEVRDPGAVVPFGMGEGDAGTARALLLAFWAWVAVLVAGVLVAAVAAAAGASLVAGPPPAKPPVLASPVEAPLR